MKRLAVCFLFLAATCLPAIAAELPIGRSFTAKDSLDVGQEANADTRECLNALAWKPAVFQVNCVAPAGNWPCDALIRFPSPIVTGDKFLDRVGMEWHAARDENGKILTAPAVVVVHESGSRMTAGRIFAKGLRQKGLHTFMIHMPHYGTRRDRSKRPDGKTIVTAIQQAVTDVRRARDAVAVLPHVDESHIALQGTSLGGFVSATAAGLDRGFHSVFIMLAGGQLYEVVKNGQRDAAKFRQAFERAGITDEQLRRLTNYIEPTRLAHRYDARTTWLYSGKYDTVVPPKHTAALAKAAGLEKSHHVEMAANHYSGIIFIPFVLKHIADNIREVHDRAR